MLNYEYPPLGGGAAPVTESLSEELVALGHEVDVVTMGYQNLPGEELRNGVMIYRVPVMRKRLEMCTFHEMFTYCISAARFLPRLLKENDYTINHTHFIIPTGAVSRLFANQLPYIITTHGSDVPGYNPDRFMLYHTLLKPFSQRIVNQASHLTSPSGYLKDEMIQHFGMRDVAVIPNGITPGRFKPDRKEKKILTVSRLFERKGIQYVIDAMAGVEEYHYVICGDGPYRPELEDRIRHLNLGERVTIRGYLEPDELRKEYETASIFVLPSFAENFPVVLLEAMSAECAIITSNTTGCAEVVGETALLVAPGDAAAIREALQAFIADETYTRNLGKASRKRAEEEFAWPAVAKKYLDLYTATAEDKTSG